MILQQHIAICSCLNLLYFISLLYLLFSYQIAWIWYRTTHLLWDAQIIVIPRIFLTIQAFYSDQKQKLANSKFMYVKFI